MAVCRLEATAAPRNHWLRRTWRALDDGVGASADIAREADAKLFGCLDTSHAERHGDEGEGQWSGVELHCGRLADTLMIVVVSMLRRSDPGDL